MDVVYVSILAAVLISGVTSNHPAVYPPPKVPPKSGPYPPKCPYQATSTLTISDQCKPFSALTNPDEADLAANAAKCAPVNCGCDSECCFDQTCYFGCQSGIYQQLITMTNECPSTESPDVYCSKLGIATFGVPPTDIEPNACNDGACGVCSEHWCARLDVIDSKIPPTNGMCERASQSGACIEDCLLPEECTGKLLCAKNIRSMSQGNGYVPPYSQYDQYAPKCALPTGYPIECDGVKSTFNPVYGSTGFDQLCMPGKSAFRITKGKCADAPAPKCLEPNYYNAYKKQPTHVLQWEVLRVADSLCDSACGSQEFRYGNWGPCAGGGKEYDSYRRRNMCFAVADHEGKDAGTCELDCVGASVHPCMYPAVPPKGGTPQAPPKHNPQAPKNPTHANENHAGPGDPGYEKPRYKDPSATGSAATHFIITAATVVLVHAFF